MKPLLNIQWRLGPDYPMGIQDSAVGVIHGKIVSAGGFSRHPKDLVAQHPDAFGGEPSGFTKLGFMLDPKNESAGWQRIPDMPGPPRQGAAVAVVDDTLYAMGGINYTEPFTYRCTCRLTENGGKWVWEELPTCELPWPVYGAAGSTAVIGKNIYLSGASDFFTPPDAAGNDFHTESGRGGSPVSRALLVLNTADLKAGWRRLADCPGVPKSNAAFAAAGGRLYQLGGLYAPLAGGYYNAVDSWMYDPACDAWTQLPDMPAGANRRALIYDDRYLVLVAGYKYFKTRHTDGTLSDAYNTEEKARAWTEFFENTVMVYDTRTRRLEAADPLLEKTSYPSSAAVGDTLYCLGGEGGPRLFHPATLQIGRIMRVD